jgi:amino acid adenylation domain-containing protein
VTAIPPAARLGQHVGVLAEPSADFAVAMFAAWSAGLGILPLPVEFPDARLRAMLDDRRPAALIASAAQAARARQLVASLPRVTVVDLGGDWGRSPRGQRPAARPQDPAYTVYTSGSTGTPKGVEIRQGQVAELVAWESENWKLGSWVRMAQTLSLGFDFGLQEVFTALPAGGTLVVPTVSDRRNALAYADFLRRENVTVLFTTPSFANELAATRRPLPDLRLVLLGGEVLHWSTVEALEGVVAPECRLINGYGPTEATVNCLAYDIPRDGQRSSEPSAIVPAGRASASAAIYLLDEHGLPVPVGAIGSLSIGGPGVADGYLHRPDLTAQRFASGPSPDAGIVYRTGDLAYLGHDGQFTVIGRSDRQVKVRGYRVELAEVELELMNAPGVVSAAVHLVGQPGRLVAVVSGQADTSAIMRHLASRLPAPMLPDRVVIVDRLPLTPNGKLDHDQSRQIAESAGRRPAVVNPSLAQIEATICQVWSEVLGVNGLDPGRNVFDEGAHSIAATHVHGQLQSLLGVPFPVSDLFEFPCPRDLAGKLSVYRRVASR